MAGEAIGPGGEPLDAGHKVPSEYLSIVIDQYYAQPWSKNILLALGSD